MKYSIISAALDNKEFDKNVVCDDIEENGDMTFSEVTDGIASVNQSIAEKKEAIKRLQSPDFDVDTADDSVARDIAMSGGVDTLIYKIDDEIEGLYICRFNLLRILLFISRVKFGCDGYFANMFAKTLERANALADYNYDEL